MDAHHHGGHGRIHVPVKLLRDELDALVTVVAEYHARLIGAGLPERAAARLVRDFHRWMLRHYQLVSRIE